MGRGIRTGDDASPVHAWHGRVQNIGSRQLSNALWDLFKGERVQCEDGVLEITSMPLLEPNSVEITVRIPTAPYKATFSAEAVARGRAGRRPDRRSSVPAPDMWRTTVTDPRGNSSPDGERPDRYTWELFNCVVRGLKTDDNAPVAQSTPVVIAEPGGGGKAP